MAFVASFAAANCVSVKITSHCTHVCIQVIQSMTAVKATLKATNL